MFRFDPDSNAEYQLRKSLRAKLGRIPTDADVLKDLHEQRAAAAAAALEYEARRAAREAEEQRKEAARRSELETRRRTRSTPPSDFRVIRQVGELQQLSMSHQAFCEKTKIEGTKEEPIKIALDLELFNFRGSVFRYVVFSGNLRGAKFEDAEFEGVTFKRDSSLEGADFSNSEFNEVSFDDGCHMEGASFQFAKFKKGITVEFDRNFLSNATFSTIRTDRWYRLSYAYAGLAQYINITLSGLYFGLILLKLYLFKIASALQDAIISNIPRVEAQSESFAQVTVSKFVFGSGLTSVAVALMILLYQALRLYLTMKIGPLIEAERRTGYTPRRDAYDPYRILHVVSRGLGAVVVVLFLNELRDLWSQAPLLIPKHLISVR